MSLVSDLVDTSHSLVCGAKLPTKDGAAEMPEEFACKGLCKNVPKLVAFVNGVHGDLTSCYVFTEMVILGVDIFCRRSHLWDLGQLECALVVLKNLAVHLQLR